MIIIIKIVKDDEVIELWLNQDVTIDVLRKLSVLPLSVFDRGEMRFIIPRSYEAETKLLLYELRRTHRLKIETLKA